MKCKAFRVEDAVNGQNEKLLIIRKKDKY